jgi:type VI protein secretion system component Hcp
MSQSEKPKARQPKAERSQKPLPEAELEQVSGGKASTSDITITKHYDKSSPNLG